ncbi:hypothetical protein [Pedobacter sp. UBA5917]|jgi:hypothetical protein|uniref:hypothetical protein n=1 Tax=Pedobacter sp. UBA5917 TaxID=1947061 RepID=UPI0025F200A3|nr:hypothetical protein [Pedobacter sp. UBA5917]
MKNRYIFIVLLFCLGCGKKTEEPNVIQPAQAKLISPLQNEICTSGTVTSATTSKIKFLWEAASNADGYTVNITYLQDGSSVIYSTAQTSLEVVLQRAKPYMWSVKSLSGNANTFSVSDSWKFYVAGEGATSYAPYPAEASYPKDGDLITALGGKTSISWQTTDVDSDMLTYSIYLGETSSPALYKADIKQNYLNDILVTSKKTYFWKVVTADKDGNKSESTLFQFKVN